jgi:hypothetical protein
MVEPIKNITMKYKQNIIILLGLLFISLVSCKKEYLDDSSITFFPDIVINGSEVVYTPTGTPYVDEGATAYENEVEITLETSSNVDETTPGTYTVDYYAENSEGYGSVAARTVYVYHSNLSTDDHSGVYIANVLRNGTEGYSGNPVSLTPHETYSGIYYISDWIAGFYSIGRGYGSAYSFTGMIQINGNNDVYEISMQNAWGDPFDEVIGTYDPGTSTIAYSAFWLDKYEFVVDMAK